MDSRIRGRRDAELWFGAPVLGALHKGMNRRLPPGLGPTGKHDERRTASLELLRARLQFSGRGNGSQGSTVLVTSAAAGSGKAAVTANVAASLARAGERVVCVDADLGQPALHKYLGVQAPAPGLVDVVESDVPLEDVLVRIELALPTTNGSPPSERRGRLELLRAGSEDLRPDPLTPEALDLLVADLRERADYVVLDSPTPLALDFYTLALKSDSVLFVARRGRTTRAQAEFARETLAWLGVGSVGLVLTDVPAGDDI